MKTTKSFLLKVSLMITLSLITLSSFSQSDSVSLKKEKALMIAVGAANVLDTYLSAEQYKGMELRVISENRSRISPKHLSHTLSQHGCLSSIDNRAGNSNEIAGMYQFHYALYYNWLISQNISVQAGGGIDAQLGILYNTRNSNNPVQMDASLNLSPSASITYSNYLKHRHYVIRYHLATPLVGLMFSPNYGQSYYEIFSKGNYDHNIVPTTIVSTPSLYQSLTIDFQLSKRKPNSMIRIGYLGDLQQSKVNNIKRHHYAHLFLIGWVRHI